MIACLDVNYVDYGATAACLVISDWSDAEPTSTYTAHIAEVQRYQSGQFFKRELPCLLNVLSKVREPIDVVLVDGYVWLRHEDDPGLGAHLFDALGGATTVIGIAKSRFGDSDVAREVLRGDSKRPLFVTACGMNADEAANCVRDMYGEFRLPAMLKLADRLCRVADIRDMPTP